jgi:hypothetical protein
MYIDYYTKFVCSSSVVYLYSSCHKMETWSRSTEVIGGQGSLFTFALTQKSLMDDGCKYNSAGRAFPQ